MSVKKNNDENDPKKGKKVAPHVTKNEKAMIESLLRNAVQDFAVKFEAKQLDKVELLERVPAFLSEYMSAFLIIGYDMKGEPLNIIHARNQKDGDALTAALNKFLFHIHNNND